MARRHRNLDDWEAEHGLVVRSVPLTHKTSVAKTNRHRIAAGQAGKSDSTKVSMRLLIQQQPEWSTRARG